MSETTQFGRADLNNELIAIKEKLTGSVNIQYACDLLLNDPLNDLLPDEISFFANHFNYNKNNPVTKGLSFLLCRALSFDTICNDTQVSAALIDLCKSQGKHVLNDEQLWGLYQDTRSQYFGIVSANRYDNLNSLTKEATKLVSDLNKRVDEEQSRINNQKSEINFVELNKAFTELTGNLVWEKRGAFSALVLLAAALIYVPYWTYSQNLATPDLTKMMPLYGPIAAVEFILFYFQRLAYHEYKSIKAQISQLKIRSAVCQFIENYRKFAVENPIATSGGDGKDGGNKFNLDKFEALIFSGLAVDPTAVPTAFDGIEQLSKLVEAVRKK